MAATQREHWHPRDGGIADGTIRTQVPNDAYREGWDRIFRKPDPLEEALEKARELDDQEFPRGR